MTRAEKIETLLPDFPPNTGNDRLEMKEDIWYQFSKLEGFEVLRIEYENTPECMVKGACLTTVADPFFQVIVTHIWQTDLAFDNEWHRFYDNGQATVFEFLTWEDDFISGEIWFERAKKEKQPV